MDELAQTSTPRLLLVHVELLLWFVRKALKSLKLILVKKRLLHLRINSMGVSLDFGEQSRRHFEFYNTIHPYRNSFSHYKKVITTLLLNFSSLRFTTVLRITNTKYLLLHKQANCTNSLERLGVNGCRLLTELLELLL